MLTPSPAATGAMNTQVAGGDYQDVLAAGKYLQSRGDVDPNRVGELQRALYKAYPTVTVINVAQALETVRSVVIQITYVIQFLAAFSIFAGIIILASSIAGTRYPLRPVRTNNPRPGGSTRRRNQPPSQQERAPRLLHAAREQEPAWPLSVYFRPRQ